MVKLCDVFLLENFVEENEATQIFSEWEFL
jgi:hypothetical protein